MKKAKLYGKTAIITGASGGIGQVIAKRFIIEGANIIGADIKPCTLEKHENFSFLRIDVKKSDSVKHLFAVARKKYGTIDILVNAAAVQSPIGHLADISEKKWIECVLTNLVGTMLCCRYALGLMRKKKRGKIINFSGGGATFPRPNYSAYASSKAGIVRFTETLAEEMKGCGVQINAVSPGSVNTNMIKEIAAAGPKNGGRDYHEAKRIIDEGGDSPELAADLCLFLASDDCRKITGKLISAVWDNYSSRKFCCAAQKDFDIFTLRRIDDRRFTAVREPHSAKRNKF